MCSAPTDPRPADALARLLAAAARGELPPPDGAVEVVRAPRGLATAAVVAFTAHHVVAADLSEDWVRARLDPDDLGAPMRADFLHWLGTELGSRYGSVDVVLVAPAHHAAPGRAAVAELRPVDPSLHPRAERALRYRTDVQVYERGDGAGVLVLGRGLAGRLEVALEVEPAYAGRGIGRALCAAARALTPDGEPIWAQIAAGNAASLRTFLAAGFVPVGSEVLFVPKR